MDFDRFTEMAATIGKLRKALMFMVVAFENNQDGLPFEDGEVPALDQARAVLAETE